MNLEGTMMMTHKFWQQKSQAIENTRKIAELRQELSSLITINNAITTEVWAIDQKLIDASGNTKQKLLRQKQALSTQLAQEHYIERIDTLKGRLYKLEVDAFGESDILSSSPSGHNSLI